MKNIVERYKERFEKLVYGVMEEKKWFFFTALVGLIFLTLLVLYLVKYSNTEFIYSLF